MRRFFGAALMATMFWLATDASPAVAQSDVNQVIFTEIEKRAIKRFYEAIGLRNPDRDDGIHRESRYSEERYSGKHKKSKKWKKHKKGKKGKAHKGKSKRMPPGLAKRQRLPKGLERRRLPTNLERQLPPPPVNVERVLVDNNIVLIQKGTNLVLDILENILTQ